jgi:fructokinase
MLAVGEVLFDCFPGGKRLGGAPCNFSIHARGLGAKVDFLTRVGDDANGKMIREKLAGLGFNLDLIQIDGDWPTGVVHVTFNDCGNPEYEIVPAAWDHIELDAESASRLSDDPPHLFYFGTLAQRTPAGASLIERLAERLAGKCTFLCDLNLRRGHVVKPRVFRSLELCDALKLNEEELAYLAAELGSTGTREQIMEELQRRFSISVIALTRGKLGSILLSESGFTRSAGVKVADPVNTVGAGDAFTAALAVGMLNDDPPGQILLRAGGLAAEVCRLPGAVPENPGFFTAFLSRPAKGETHGQ